jgi:lipopolysaccharide/colanic/teichoic acid biosynthesis glycosyltransferase
MSPTEHVLKRAFDICASAAGLLLLSPLFLVVAVLIRLDSKGPVFYPSIRVGQNGCTFRMWKFRTMYMNSESRGITTGKHDPRITRVGAYLRKYKIDELPQLLNVLQGDMSFVGPRPEFEQHTSAYREDEKLILTVRPGITDYASLRFQNLGDLLHTEDPHRVYLEKFHQEKNQLRIAYVRKQSMGEDFRILFRTLARVIARS